MRKLIYAMGVSLDGYIEGTKGEGDWAGPDEELHRFHNDQARELGAHLLGRRLYEVMSYWETFEERNPEGAAHHVEFARIWKELPKVVYSTTLTSVEGKTRLSSEDPVEEVPRLKAEPGKPLAVGGADLASSLTRHGLIDEYRLFVSPVVLGGGKPFFADQEGRLDLELVETRTFGSGTTYLRYERKPKKS